MRRHPRHDVGAAAAGGLPLSRLRGPAGGEAPLLLPPGASLGAAMQPSDLARACQGSSCPARLHTLQAGCQRRTDRSCRGALGRRRCTQGPGLPLSGRPLSPLHPAQWELHVGSTSSKKWKASFKVSPAPALPPRQPPCSSVPCSVRTRPVRRATALLCRPCQQRTTHAGRTHPHPAWLCPRPRRCGPAAPRACLATATASRSGAGWR